jgi:hypothetical protein
VVVNGGKVTGSPRHDHDLEVSAFINELAPSLS